MKNSSKISRREFIENAAVASAALTLGASPLQGNPQPVAPGKHSFKLKYAPHFGMFKHHAGEGHIDQLKFMADQGFTALEDNGMMGRDVALQEKIAAEMARLNMEMGVFVAYADFGNATFVTDSADVRDMLGEDVLSVAEAMIDAASAYIESDGEFEPEPLEAATAPVIH